MIRSADEFVTLRESENLDEQFRSSHEKASKGVWMEVVRRYPHMREWVVHNKTVPVSILSYLSADKNPRVRAAVAMKRNLNRCLFEKLSADTEQEVRTRIAYNNKTPRDILERLSRDSDELVRFPATQKLKER